jgi:hypothetical protein
VDRIDALRLAGTLAVAYPGRTVTEDHARSWARELMPLSESEGNRVVALLTSRSIDPPSRAQVIQALDEVKARVRKEISSPVFDPSLCVFLEGIECRNCGEIHGHLLNSAQVFHGIYHLGRHWQGEPDQFEPAQNPEACECGFLLPEDVDVRKTIDLVIADLVR